MLERGETLTHTFDSQIHFTFCTFNINEKTINYNPLYTTPIGPPPVLSSPSQVLFLKKSISFKNEDEPVIMQSEYLVAVLAQAQ